MRDGSLSLHSGYIETAHAQSIEDGLGGHWTFDKGDTDAKVAKDALGENDGEIKGAPKIVEGIVGDALSFNGKEDYVVMGPATTGQDLTYAMWINPVALPEGPKVIIWDDDPQGGRRFVAGTLSGRHNTKPKEAGDGFGVFKTATAVEAGEWTHVTFVRCWRGREKIPLPQW